MADKTSSTTSNTPEITITSIIKSIEDLSEAINKEIEENKAITTGVEREDNSIGDPKERSHHASDGGINTEVTNLTKGHNGDHSVGGGDSSRGEKLSPKDKLDRNTFQMRDALGKLRKYVTELQQKIERAKQTSTVAMKKRRAAQLSGAGSSSGAQEDEDKILQELVKEVRKLRHQIPTLHKSSFKDSGAHDRDSESSIDGVRTNMEIYNRPSMQMSESLKQSYVFTEIKQIYEGLETQNKKDCLLCFAVFPENEELKKRTLTYWWEGEDLLRPKDDKTVEKFARDLLDDFVKKGLIEPIYKKRREKARRYRMNPIVHGVVVKIAEDKNFFVYDDKGNPKAIFQKNDEKDEKKDEKICTKACLLKVEKGTATPQQQKKKGNGKKNNGSKDTKGERPDFTVEMKVETIFNFNEPFPDLRMESFAKKKEADVAEWLLKMKNLKVLHLGRWQASVKHHIEVETTDFLEGLKNMGKLRLFSLQGVSRIDALTRSIKGLTNLKILDLKACHNLEVLPKEISYLKNLTHLDVSDCYLIDHMPKGLSNLTNLQVLEGFVVGHQRSGKHCTLDGLKGMKNLRKLSLNISKKDFPSTEELEYLEKLTSLKRLKMSWGADLNTEKNNDEHDTNSRLPSDLKKLDLLCFPEVTSPNWLEPEKLKNLLKLCIRGGCFGELKKKQQKWNSVKTLRLKFLSEVKMSWQELQVEFPHLECFEKVGCPRITFCPCDDNGVWVKPPEEVEPSKETGTSAGPANGDSSGSEIEKDKKPEGSPKDKQSTQPKKAKKSEEVEDKAQAKPSEQPKKLEQSAQPEKAKEPEKKKQTEEPKKPEQKSEKTKQSEDAKKSEQSKSESEQQKKPKQSEEAEKAKKSEQSEKSEQSKS